jgi:quercetin dioxygenase-like cupin family protein/DNA-binding XRE family transcriptional regulator
MKQRRSVSTADGGVAVGPMLRKLRKSANLTLAEVAEGVDISQSFLSLVENEKSDITIGRLTRLVQFFGVSITDLLPETAASDVDVTRKDERGRLRSPAEGIEIFMLAPTKGRTLMPMLLEFEPGARRSEHGRHAGEEFVYVVEGELTLEVAGSDTHVLRAGDSAIYSGDRPHLFRNASDKKSLRLICVDSSHVL